MKKRVLSLVLAFVLSFSMMPMSAFAEEPGTVTEQETQKGKNSATGEDISSGNAVTKDVAVEAAQALINALPEEVTAENADGLQTQLMAIDKAMEALNDEQRAELNMTHYENICVALTTFVAAQNGEHTHPICGATCTDGMGHSNITWTATSTLDSSMAAGNYYLTDDVILNVTWTPKNDTVLDLNGHSITVNADAAAITVPDSCSFTLTDCNSSDGKHYFTKNTEKKNLWESVGTGGDITVTGGIITHSSDKNGAGISLEANATFTMYGGTICGNYNSSDSGAGVMGGYNNAQIKMIMYGGAISGNVTPYFHGGGVYLNGAGNSFDMSGNAKITDNTAGSNGGGVYMGCAIGAVSFNMSGNAQITGNMCAGNGTYGGAGLYAAGGEFTMHDNAVISDNCTLGNKGYGGGVLVSIGAAFTMNDNATISGNSAYIESTSPLKRNYGGGVFVYGGTFTMNGGSIRDNKAENGAGVYVKNESSSYTSTFIMNGGTITNNKVIKGNGGGVYAVDAATFKIANGASVKDNWCDDKANNVYLPDGKSIVITGSLTGNKSVGVTVENLPEEDNYVTVAGGYGTYTVNDSDEAAFFADGYENNEYNVYCMGHQLRLYNGERHTHKVCVGTNCTNSSHDAVFWTPISTADELRKINVNNSKNQYYYLEKDIELPETVSAWAYAWMPADKVVLCLNGHSITQPGTTPVISVGADKKDYTFTLTDCRGGKEDGEYGKITNTNEKSDYAIKVHSGSVFHFYGGCITGNASGIDTVQVNGAFHMYGGEIKGNVKTVSYPNSIVTVYKDGIFHMTGGKITGNSGGAACGGVYVYEGGTITVSGDAEITDNVIGGTKGADGLYTGGTTRNVYLSSGRTITVVGALNASAKIGVTSADTPTDGNPVTIANAAENDWIQAGNFTSDSSLYNVDVSEDGKAASLKPHDHELGVQVSSTDTSTLEEHCIVEGCDVTGGTLTLTADSREYDAEPHAATWTTEEWKGKPVPADTPISYEKKLAGGTFEPLSEAPTAWGDYRASITVGTATATKEFSIRPLSRLNSGDFAFTAPDNLVYNGQPKMATVTLRSAIASAAGTVTVNYYDENHNRINDADGNPAKGVTEAGTYTVEINVTAGDGYREESGMYDEKWKFTIEKAEQTLSFESSAIEKIYGDADFTNALAKTSTYFGTITYSSSDTTVADVDENGKVTIHGAGTATITATAAATPNYNIGTATYELTVAKALIHVDGEPKAYNKTYDGTTDAKVGEVSFADKNGDKVLLTEGTDYTVTGTFSSPNVSISPQEVKVKVEVTLLEDCAKNYELEAATCEARATIFAKYISIVGASAKGREYKKGNTTVTIDSVDFNGVVTQLVKGTDYTVTGEMKNADAGTNKEVTVTVTLSGDAANNYYFDDNTTIATVDISKATPVIDYDTDWRELRNNGKEVDISDWATFNNTDDGAKLSYNLVGDVEGITLEKNKLKAATTVPEKTKFSIKVTADETTNFNKPAEQTITVEVVDKELVIVRIVTQLDRDIVYGDSDFSLTADFSHTGTVPTEGDNGTWSWNSSDDSVLEITSGKNTTTPTISVKKAGSARLSVNYTSDNYYSNSDSVWITVNPKAITVDMIGDIPAQVYTGKDIEPTPEVKDGTTKLTSGTDFTYSYSNNRNAGTATLTITGKDNYKGEVTKKFTISPKSINDAMIVLDAKSLPYTGLEQTVNITSVKLSDGTILGTDDYVIKDNSNKATDAGEIILTIEGKGNYTGTATTTWEITKINPELKDFVVRPEDLTTALTYDGTAKTVTVTTADSINGMGEITVKYNGSTEAPTNAGSYKVTFEVADGTNYNAKTFNIGTLTINKAAAPALNDIEVGYKYTLTGEKTVKLADLVAGATGYTLGVIIGDTDIISNPSVDADGVLKYTLTGKGKIDDTVTLPVTITSVNYEDTTVKVVITLKAKDDQAALSITGDNTVVYGKTLTLGTTGGSGTGKVTYSIDEANSTGEATIDANGVLTPVKVGSITVIATKASDADYNEATSAAFIITITKAGSTGEPKYTVITTDGKTLADAGLTLTGSTLNPAEGTLKWVDEAGNELSDDTKVEVNKTYKWCFTPADTNYDTLTGEVELWHVDAPAISAQPKNVSVITGEKATFEVTATGTDVTYQWQIDRNDGKGFVDITGANSASYTTGVTDKGCDGFKYQCVIRNAAGSVTTDTAVLTVKEKYIITATAGENGSISPNGTVEVVEGSNQTFVIAAEEGYEIESLTVDGTAVNADASYTFENVTAAHTIAVTFKQQYKILDGANSSWIQNTDGSGSIKIRGNGGFSKFREVKVDGNTVDPVNYTAREGSTIIEFKPEYLKTLSEGSHTFELVWTDGSASTSFTIAKNTSGSEDPGNKDTGNEDTGNNDTGNNDTGNDNTAQTLTKSPKTGDASGLWIALFAASAAGLAVMLVRRKKH